MKKIIILSLIVSQVFGYGQEKKIENTNQKVDSVEATKALNKILDVTQKISIHTKNVDWKILTPQVKAALKTDAPNLFLALKPSIELLLDKLNDNHSHLIYNNSQRAFRIDVKNFRPTFSTAISAALINNQNKVKTEKISGNIGYILVPGNNVDLSDKANQEKVLGQEIRNALCQLSPADLKGIIVDLRLNTGGDMYPMIGGLGPLFGNGLAGSFIANGKTVSSWRIDDGNVNGLMLDNKCFPNKDIKIAVLIGGATASSGEATAISFIGKPNVKVIGENSAGYTSANMDIKIADNLYYLLASSYEADRTKKEYKDFVTPDILIKDGDNFKDLSQDKKVQKAVEWINP